MSATSSIDGFVARRYEAIAEEFARNFTDRGEVGAAFAVYEDSEPVVDLWGGIADRAAGRPWRQDTLQVIFSGTKGLVAVCMLILLERGDLHLDQPVARYWPEFAAAGKDRVLVRDVVSHRAGLPCFRTKLDIESFVDASLLAELLAAQEPLVEPGTQMRYHAFTYGYLCGELLCRVDGRSLGRFFAEEIAQPLDLELWIGLSEELEGRVATLELAPDWGTSATVAERDEIAALVVANPPTLEPASFPWNSRAYHAAEIGGAGAIGSARSIARLYACLARGGELDGIRLLREETIRLARTELSRGYEPLVGGPLAFGVGFSVQTELNSLGPPADAFGHGGAGGSIHGAWPTERVGFSYAMNLLRDDQPADRRPQALLRAVHGVVAHEARAWTSG